MQNEINNFLEYGFLSDYSGEILKFDAKRQLYIGYIELFEESKNIVPCTWNRDGISSETIFHIKKLTNMKFYEASDQYILSKDNNSGFLPLKKFKIAWTEDMKNNLLSSGWKLAKESDVQHLIYDKDSE